MSPPAWRAAFRIARRDALRAKGRSVLVVVMIGLPMLALAFLDVAVRTSQPPAAERARRELGAADLVGELVSAGPLRQSGLDSYQPGEGSPEQAAQPFTERDLLALLPRGSRVIPRETYYGGSFTTAAGDRRGAGLLYRYDVGDPLARGVVRLRSGRFPNAAGETALTTTLAEYLGVDVGDAVRVGGDTTLRVTGTVVDPKSLGELAAYVLPTGDPPPGLGLDIAAQRAWAVDLPDGSNDTDLVASLNEHGLVARPRTWYFHPPHGPRSPLASHDGGIAAIVVGLAILEVVLLAGAAFAVGARRSRRELALVVAAGGDRRDVRRVVLAGAIVLGGVAGLIGVTGGVAFAAATRTTLMQDFETAAIGPLDVRPAELALVVLAGVGTALLAALLPARTAARQPVLAALTGRRGQVRTPRRVPVIGTAAVVVGAVLAFWAAGADTSRRTIFWLVLVGAALVELGFVAMAPSMVGAVARLASRLPLTPRLATRDAARHRSRSGPAVAAVVAAVAGSVAVTVYLSSDTERQRRAYRPNYPAGTVSVAWPEDPTKADAMAARIVREIPARTRIDRARADTCGYSEDCRYWQLEPPAASGCPVTEDPEPDCLTSGEGAIDVASPALVSLFAGRSDPRVEDALRHGAVAVFDPRWVEDGHVVVSRYSPGPSMTGEASVRLPAVVVRATGRYDQLPQGVVTPETARAAHIDWHPYQLVFPTTRTPTRAEQARADAAASDGNLYYQLEVERGFHAANGLVLMALFGASVLVTVGATGVATGLAAAESLPDLATLAAVGAPPRVRRRLAMAQAGVVAVLGSAFGIVAGLVPAIAVVAARQAVPLAVPVRSLAVSAVGVPLLAALLAGALTRSRLPMERRMT